MDFYNKNNIWPMFLKVSILIAPIYSFTIKIQVLYIFLIA